MVFILDDHLNFNKHIFELCKQVTHKLYIMSEVRKYLTTEACIIIFKTMILALFEYGDIIYSGTSSDNLKKIDRLFYRGLPICTGTQIKYSEYEECKECKTRLHMAPVFWYYKPNNEKAKLNVIYRGAIE